MVSIKEVKKGNRVKLRNGWFATVLDNKANAHTRMCLVGGIVTEMGSVYSTDIVSVRVRELDDVWEEVEHTPGQTEAALQRAFMGF